MQNIMNPTYPIKLIALLLAPATMLGMDIYAPSLPAITTFFQTTPDLAKLSMAIYLLGYALGLIIFGALSDSLGRRYTLLLGLTFSTLSCFLTPFIHSIYTLIFLRILQGFFIASAGINMRSLLTDTLDDNQLAKSLSNISVMWGVGIIIAPFIGGYLQFHFGWKSNFYFLTGYNLFLFFLIFFYLPETLKEKAGFYFKRLYKNYLIILKNQSFLLACSCMAILDGVIVVIPIITSFIIQDKLGYSAVDFGHFALAAGFCWFSGSLFNRFLLNFRLFQKFLFLTFGLLILTSLLFLIISWLFPPGVWRLAIPTFLFFFFSGIIFPDLFTKTLSFFKKASGAVGSIQGFLLTVGTALVGSFSSLLTTQLTLSIACFFFIMIAFLLYCYISLCSKYHLTHSH